MPDAKSTLATAAARVTCHSCCSCFSHVDTQRSREETCIDHHVFRLQRHSGTQPNLSDLAAVVQTLQQEDALLNLQQRRDANNNMQAFVMMFDSDNTKTCSDM